MSVRHLTKKFTRRGKQTDGSSSITPVNDVSFDVGQGEFVVLVGPSGCGKTTLLRCVAGLERPDSGTIGIGSSTVFSSERGTFVPANRRPVSMMFQSYALWPHMTVFENVAYPLKIQGVRGAALKERVMTILGIVGLGRLAEQHPSHISGGEQQRVAVARALAVDAGVVLFDEPLSNVDAKVREQLRVDLMRVHREIGFAALYVTHDQGEALELADRIAVLNSGEVEQFGAPSEVYHKPASAYVADFLGSANIIRATVTSVDGDRYEARTDSDVRIAGRSNHPGLSKGERVGAMFRPEHTVVTSQLPKADKGMNWFQATLIADLFQGAHVEYVAMQGETRLRAWDSKGGVTSSDSEVYFGVRDENVQMLPLSRHGWGFRDE